MLCPLLPCRLHHGSADSSVGTAPAEVSAQPMLDLFRRGIGMLVKKRFGGDDEPRRAEPALLRIVVDERLLHGMKLARFAQPFYGGDLPALNVDGQHRA